MLRRTFLGILAAIPFWRKATAEKPKLEYRIVPLTIPPSKGNCGQCSLPVRHTYPWYFDGVPYHEDCFRNYLRMLDD